MAYQNSRSVTGLELSWGMRHDACMFAAGFGGAGRTRRSANVPLRVQHAQNPLIRHISCRSGVENSLLVVTAHFLKDLSFSCSIV